MRQVARERHSDLRAATERYRLVCQARSPLPADAMAGLSGSATGAGNGVGRSSTLGFLSRALKYA